MNRALPPPDFGDFGQRHEVNVFVFRITPAGIEYLLLRPRPEHEAVWRPVIHPVGLNEDLYRAARRGVQLETGLDSALDLVASDYALVRGVGDLQIVDWPFGCLLRDPLMEVRRRAQVAATSWRSFQEALQIMDTGTYRQNLLQLHWKLAG